MNYPINHTNFKISKGIRTEILFFIKNIDNVPVTTLVSLPKIVIVTQEQDIQIATKDFEVVDSTKGLWKIVFTPEDMETIPLGGYIYSVVCDTGAGEVAIYTDKGYGCTGVCEAVRGPYAMRKDPITIKQNEFRWEDGYWITGAYKSAENAYQTGNHTISFDLNQFVGNVAVEASTFEQPSANPLDWGSVYYTDVPALTSNTIAVSLPQDGYKWLRFKASSNAITQVIYDRYMN